MTEHRSLVHMLAVAAARIKEDYGSASLVKSLRDAAESMARRRAEGRDYRAEERRIERQRQLFDALPVGDARDALLRDMQQRIYDLMWDGDAYGADAIAEYLPLPAADAAFEAWEDDTSGLEPKSSFYESPPNEAKTCAMCGGPIPAARVFKKSVRYCSSLCSGRAQQRRYRERLAAGTVGPWPEPLRRARDAS